MREAYLVGSGSSKGFEGALDILQTQQSSSLKGFEIALMRAFDTMNRAYSERPDFNFSNDIRFSVTKFLTHFDAIFTLNQDALMEMHYLANSPELLSDGRLNGCGIPGMR